MPTSDRTAESEIALHAQATCILATLDDWLRSAPDRIVRITHTLADGFVVTLVEQHSSRGDSLRDAAAQITTTLMLQGGAL